MTVEILISINSNENFICVLTVHVASVNIMTNFQQTCKITASACDSEETFNKLPKNQHRKAVDQCFNSIHKLNSVFEEL